MRFKKLLLLCAVFALMFSAPAGAESLADCVFVDTATSYQAPTGSSEYVYACTIDCIPTGLIVENNGSAGYVDLRMEYELSPYYRVYVGDDVFTDCLKIKFQDEFIKKHPGVIPPNRYPVTIKIVGEKDSKPVIQEFLIPEKETAIYPVPGCYSIMEPYGNPRNNQYKYHHGVDIATPPEGIPIIASTGGKFIFAGECPERSLYGKHIIIEQRTGDKIYHHIYGHLSKINLDQSWIDAIALNSSDVIAEQGEQIGVSGNSGCTKHHLHYEVRDVTNGDTSVHAAIDPFSIIPRI